MQWGVVWTIILISVAMWFLSNLFRGGEDERAQGRPGQDPRRNPGGRGKTAGADIDRFLEEINRRRKEAAERQGVKPPEALSPATARPRRPRPQRPEPSPRSAQIPMALPVARAERRPEVRRTLEEPVLAVAVEEVVKPASERKPARTALPAARVQAVAVVAEPVLPASLTAIATVSMKAQSPALTQLMSLLRTPQTLRTAVLLHEILGPPRCRRR
jgi:hypothetical protein